MSSKSRYALDLDLVLNPDLPEGFDEAWYEDRTIITPLSLSPLELGAEYEDEDDDEDDEYDEDEEDEDWFQCAGDEFEGQWEKTFQYDDIVGTPIFGFYPIPSKRS